MTDTIAMHGHNIIDLVSVCPDGIRLTARTNPLPKVAPSHPHSTRLSIEPTLLEKEWLSSLSDLK